MFKQTDKPSNAIKSLWFFFVYKSGDKFLRIRWGTRSSRR